MIRVFIGQGGYDLHALVELLDQVYKARDRRGGQLGIERLLIAHGSVGTVAESHGGFADGSRVKGSGFEGEGVGILDDLTVQTAHDARDRDRGIVVADHQCFGVDMALHAVEGGEVKILLKALDTDLADLARVERVHRLTHLEHEVIGHVGEEVDRAHTAVEQTDPHINRADTAGAVLELQGRITVAQRILDLHVDLGQVIVCF